MKNNIKAEIIAHSKRAGTGDEMITYKLTFPRIILSEVNTYKMLEKNTSSSRAIPFEKMVEVIEKEPFIPIAWQLSHKGMQGNKYITDPYIVEKKRGYWLDARDKAIVSASNLVSSEVSSTEYKQNEDGSFEEKSVTLISNSTVTKQIANRLLEPWMWVTQLVTGSRESFKHLFEQRCPQYEIDGNAFGKLYYKSKKSAIECCNMNGVSNYPRIDDDLAWLKINKGQAEIHFMDLAEKMYDALNESTPDILKGGEWHIPFSEDIWGFGDTDMLNFPDFIKMSVCLTAKISYTKIGDENTITLEKAREMYEKLKNSGHWSCFGHIAKCMTDEDYRSWYKGFISTKTFTNDYGGSSTGLDSNDFLKAQGYNKNLKGFISLRQYVEDGIELKDI